MPRHFYIIYFTYNQKSNLSRIVQIAQNIFNHCTIDASYIDDRLARLLITRDKAFENNQIASFEHVAFYNYNLENILSHCSQISQKDNVVSFGVKLNFSLWETISLKRFFFVHFIRKMLQSDRSPFVFMVSGNHLCFIIQVPNNLVNSIANYYERSFGSTDSDFLKTIL